MAVSRGKKIAVAFLILSLLLCSSSSIRVIAEGADHCVHGGDKEGEQCKANENGIEDLDDDFDDTFKIVNKIAVNPPSGRSAVASSGAEPERTGR